MADISNPFRGPARNPEWARLTRLAGDRVALLLKLLRTGIGKIEGLDEEISSYDPAAGWTIRYSIAKELLFTLTVRPGMLESAMATDNSESDGLASGTRSGNASHDGLILLRRQLANSKDIRSFLKLVVKSSRLRGARPRRSLNRQTSAPKAGVNESSRQPV